jgi:hypothetical protein
MTRLLIIPALTLAATGCVASTHGRLGVGAGEAELAPPDHSPPAPEAGGDPGPGRGPEEDEHWFTSEDYLVSKQPYEGAPRLWIRQGKMMTRPTAATRSEARFLLANGREMWTSHYWRTRVAAAGDLSLGVLVFCPQGGGRAPVDERDARRKNWVLGAVTDVSDLYKGMVAVGTRDCEVQALRVPIE